MVIDHGKKRKLNLVQGNDRNKDIISSLPSCVLSHILSFLPTKDAVGTCLLSTRWQDLWTGLPNIDFDDKLVYFSTDLKEKLQNSDENTLFHDFVERVLIHRDITNITKFRLSCRVWCETRVSAWISSAVKRNVKELEVFLELEKRFHLPRSIFNSQSLRTLKICMECALKLPNNVFLPNLKTLYLGAVVFSDEVTVLKLLSGCSSLEELKLIDCDWGKLESITVSIPTLKRLRIDELFHLSLPNKTSDCIIKLHTPNLVSFEYIGDLFNAIVLENQLSWLVDATVFVVERPGSKFDCAPDVFNLFARLKNVTALRVSNRTIKSLFVAERFLGQLPVFQKLIQLELNVGIQDICAEALLKFLVRFPRLEILTFHEGGFFDYPHLHDDVCGLILPPRCNLPRLKTINLCYVRGGSMAEIYVLKNLVEIAPSLEKVSICCGSEMNSSRKNDIEQKVQMLLDGSRASFSVLFL